MEVGGEKRRTSEAGRGGGISGYTDIAAWLQSLQLEVYTPLFQRAEVDLAVVPHLTDEDLKEIGVGALGPRKKILAAAQGRAYEGDSKPPSRAASRSSIDVPPPADAQRSTSPPQRNPSAKQLQKAPTARQAPGQGIPSRQESALPQSTAVRQTSAAPNPQQYQAAAQQPQYVQPQYAYPQGQVQYIPVVVNAGYNPAYGPMVPPGAAVIGRNQVVQPVYYPAADIAAVPPMPGITRPPPTAYEYKAPCFNDAEMLSRKASKGRPDQLTSLNKKYKRKTTMNAAAWVVFISYMISLGYYLYVRIHYSLKGLPYLGYGIYILVVECIGATTVIIYGLNLLWSPVNDDVEMDPDSPGKPRVKQAYHIRIMVPCYKESLEILRRTIMAAYDAVLPEGCSRTIYLCDDGKDPLKRKWVEKLGADVVYVSGRKRSPDEMNGKSGNLNNCCSQIYPEGAPIPGNELICVFDADQIAKPHFFLKTVPLFDGGDDVGMVLSPQYFHNVNKHADLFNHTNLHFWEYMQVGYDALGFISCTGTNFLVRAKAFQDVGWSPTYTLTEDYALGMELKKKQWHCRYVNEYLAVGEAPDQIRNCYQQRSRWCKGHFQIMFNLRVMPLTQRGLSLPMKIMYCSGVWSYVVGAISTPTFILIPLINIWLGVFPVKVDWHMALALTLYSILTHMLLFYVRKPQHLEALWFANVANSLLWWTYVKACWNAGFGACCGRRIAFKATLKGKGANILMKLSAVRDLWLPFLCFSALVITIALCIFKVITDPVAQDNIVDGPLAVSVLWAVFNCIPLWLLFTYVFFGTGFVTHFMCRFAMLVSFISGAVAVGLMWNISGDKQFAYSGLLPLTLQGVTIPKADLGGLS